MACIDVLPDTCSAPDGAATGEGSVAEAVAPATNKSTLSNSSPSAMSASASSMTSGAPSSNSGIPHNSAAGDTPQACAVDLVPPALAAPPLGPGGCSGSLSEAVINASASKIHGESWPFAKGDTTPELTMEASADAPGETREWAPTKFGVSTPKPGVSPVLVVNGTAGPNFWINLTFAPCSFMASRCSCLRSSKSDAAVLTQLSTGWDAILSATVRAPPERLQSFVALEDTMRSPSRPNPRPLCSPPPPPSAKAPAPPTGPRPPRGVGCGEARGVAGRRGYVRG
mmetsp:Transcript_44559/g.129566  ORF Transcript_44559/g.129566 Transcript_44559/m.129566 type:complete len:284 (-) Transcript_44559:1060-1911(-)